MQMSDGAKCAKGTVSCRDGVHSTHASRCIGCHFCIELTSWTDSARQRIAASAKTTVRTRKEW